MSDNWQVGRANHPKRDDPWFDTLEDAEDWALDPANADFIMAIWNAAHDTEELVWEGTIWTP